ncbi:MAG: acetolactate synthase large subunit [Rhodocyclaceae bacterium]|nr:acetolactate synthase large subunit [Rhodocyclaceae bacterium]MCP5252881.1 acetolactate synthase large subunit [Zoogloeaceae bacterium]MCP5293147.1 acetolactate synthase large subunit [Zoogloeaceae bacterium]MCW5615016.1 acetolactate synthase large subunit [Rhodocyclaceae bacterium]
MKNGAQALIETLVRSGIEVCFANPGTSEMQLVQAIDQVPGIRPVLTLFEGVATGAADGYARMAGKPACTLLHCGPGFANGMANLHNARKARSPVVNVVGDHATYHVRFDAPLSADLEGIARPVSDWLQCASTPAELPRLGAEAVAAAGGLPGRVATLMVPADSAWGELRADFEPPALPAAEALPQVGASQIEAVAGALRKAGRAVLLLGGEALLGEGARQAGRIAARGPLRLIAETFNRRVERGAGRVAIEFLPYFGERALAMLDGADLIVLAGAKRPVAFFAYPGKPSVLVPPGCKLAVLAGPGDDVVAALTGLADALGAPAQPASPQGRPALPPPGPVLDARSAAGVIARCLPEGAIVVDEAITGSMYAQQACAEAPPHDWLQLMGGSIGEGLPLAVGAAVACPDRKVICLEGDGSAMYTVQALWTMARERLDVISVIYANRSYAILDIEFERVGVGAPGPRALSMLDLGNPALGWTEIARGMGVHSERVETPGAFEAALRAMLNSRGPHLIEVALK